MNSDESNSTLSEEEGSGLRLAPGLSADVLFRLTESALDPIIMMDAAGRISYWNRAASELFGYRAYEALGKNLHELLLAEREHERAHLGVASFAKTGDGPLIGTTREVSALTKTGEPLVVDLSISPVRFKGQWNAVGIVRDVTERRQSERALLERQQELRVLSAALEQLEDIVVVTNPDGAIRYVNAKFERVTGYSREDVLGKVAVASSPGR